MTAGSYLDAFDPDGKSAKLCRNCGLCLQRCPIMAMSREEAVAEHARLRSGEDTLRALKECTLCYNCNSYCPHGLNPMALIMGRVAERIEKSGKGVPDFIQYLFIGRGAPSAYEDVYDTLSDDEQTVLDSWEEPPPRSDEVLFVGCIGREIPLEIERSSVLKTLPKYGPRLACCGELPFRLGDFAEFASNAKRAQAFFEKLDVKRVVCYCGSCTHTLKNVWRQYLGVELPFEVVSLWEWLWERVRSGALPVKQRLNRRVALSDSCYGSELGDSFFEAVRGLHEAVGMEVVELKNNRYDNLCCGMVSTVRNDFDLTLPLVVARKKMEQVVESGAGAVACYCPGCLARLAGPAKANGLESHYSLEEILVALGDDCTIPLKARLAVNGRLVLEQVQKHLARSATSQVK